MSETEVRDLILRTRGGDDRAFEKLTEQYRPLLLSVASSFEATAKERGIYGIFADLYQELTLSLYRAAVSFDTTREKITFGNYAKRCLRNCAVSLLRKYTSAKRRESRATDSLKKEHGAGSIFSELTGVDKDSVLSAARNALSDYEYSVFTRYIDGMKVSDIAADTGHSAKSVSNAVFRSRSKIRKYYLDVNGK